MSLSDPAELNVAFELELGRRAPFTMLGDWVLLSGASSEARALWWALSSHLNVKRNDAEVWPGLATLARLLHLKKPEHVARYLLELEVIEAVTVKRVEAGLKRRHRYVIHQTPSAGYAGPRSMGEWYALNRGPRSETDEQRRQRESEFDLWLEAVRKGLKEHCARVAAERTRARRDKERPPPLTAFRAPAIEDFRTPLGGGTEPSAQTSALEDVPLSEGVRPPARRGSVPPPGGVEEDEGEADQHQRDRDAPAARSAGDGRRPTHRSKAADPRPALTRERSFRMSAEQSRAVRTVEAAFPSELREGLPGYRPKVLRDAVLAALEWRSAEEVAERVGRRWYTWGFCDDAAHGRLERPVGIAVRLVGDGDCGAPRCEDGVDIDTGSVCPRCAERAARRSRSSARPVEAPPEPPATPSRPGPMWECRRPDCRTPVKGPRPSDQLCPSCAAEYGGN
ncbi:hypothetical protein [Streptomyces sp. NBC_00209]|uniref:hypothetical protein n=1 Tax=Streptomyces sp. NBC_00209 TaxID=2975682 RepID=UPI002F90F847